MNASDLSPEYLRGVERLVAMGKAWASVRPDQEAGDLFCCLSTVVDRCRNGRRRIAVVGSFSAGKTTLVNSLLDLPPDLCLPTGLSETTAVPTVVRPSERSQLLLWQDGRLVEAPTAVEAEFRSLTKSSMGPLLKLHLASHNELVFETPAPESMRDLEFLDLPGLQGAHSAADRKSLAAIAGADAVIYVVNAKGGGLQQADIAFLESGIRAGVPVAIAVTHTDLLPPARVTEVVKAVKASGAKVAGVQSGVIEFRKDRPATADAWHSLRRLLERADPFATLEGLHRLILEELSKRELADPDPGGTFLHSQWLLADAWNLTPAVARTVKYANPDFGTGDELAVSPSGRHWAGAVPYPGGYWLVVDGEPQISVEHGHIRDLTFVGERCLVVFAWPALDGHQQQYALWWDGNTLISGVTAMTVRRSRDGQFWAAQYRSNDGWHVLVNGNTPIPLGESFVDHPQGGVKLAGSGGCWIVCKNAGRFLWNGADASWPGEYAYLSPSGNQIASEDCHTIYTGSGNHEVGSGDAPVQMVGISDKGKIVAATTKRLLAVTECGPTFGWDVEDVFELDFPSGSEDWVATVKREGQWRVVYGPFKSNVKPWTEPFDGLSRLCFAPSGATWGVLARRDSGSLVVVNGAVVGGPFPSCADLVFSSCGSHWATRVISDQGESVATAKGTSALYDLVSPPVLREEGVAVFAAVRNGIVLVEEF